MKVTMDKSFLLMLAESITLGGGVENKEVLMNISDTNISGYINTNNLIATKFNLEGKFGDLGEVGIDNLPLFTKTLSTIKAKDVEVEKQENKLVIKNKKTKFVSVLRNPKYILNSIPKDKFDVLRGKAAGNSFELNKDIIKELVEAFNTFNPSSILLEGDGNEVYFTVENSQNEFSNSFEVKKPVTKFSVKMGKIFIELLAYLKGNVTLSINNEAPVLVEYAIDKLNVEYIVAPTK